MTVVDSDEDDMDELLVTPTGRSDFALEPAVLVPPVDELRKFLTERLADIDEDCDVELVVTVGCESAISALTLFVDSSVKTDDCCLAVDACFHAKSEDSNSWQFCDSDKE